MAASTRTDIHRPSAAEFDPDDYELVAVHDNSPEPGIGTNLGFLQLRRELIAEGWTFGGVHGGTGRCDHCGSYLRYSALMKHLPTRTLIYVGEQCLGNRFEMSKAAFQDARRAGKLSSERAAIAEARHALIEDHPELAELTKINEADALIHESEFLADIAGRFMRSGYLSERQVAAVERTVRALRAHRERQSARRAADAAELPPLPVGRVTITGEVLSVKWKDNDFGGAFKITVKTEAGHRVWGSLPRGVDEDSIKGETVEFVATVDASDDAGFGFFKRPAKFKII